MPDITIVRQNPTAIPDADAATARNVIFGIVDGLGDKGRQQWRRLWGNIMRLEPGEMVVITTKQPRLGWYHRKHFALEQTLFESQERFEQFEQFRNWIKLGAGHCDWFPGGRGAVVPVPKSISYASMDQGEMEQFHGDVVNFLRTDHACKVLWPHLKTPAQRIEMIESILGDFRE